MEEKEKTLASEASEETVAEANAETTVEEEAAPELSELEKAQAENKELNDKYLRLAAEYDNFRKRTSREREGMYGDAKALTVGAFLAVYDNLERAVANPTTDENYKKGVELIFTEFQATLTKLGVDIIDPTGATFDPNYHNAVMHEENEELGENVVAEVFQKGFKAGDRVIRPALVKVAN